MYRVILAGSQKEAGTYAKEQGWRVGSYRIAARAGTIKGLQVAEVHELPSFEKRMDRHAIRATLRYARRLQHFLIDDTPEWPPNFPDPDQGALDFGWSPLVAEALADDSESDLERMDSDYDVVIHNLQEASPAEVAKEVKRALDSRKAYEPIGAFAI